ncbi:hypothetical protein NC652_009478 [Populus alba x Populus x berolinensis]|uniref:Uncharacterized protein n=1 Tax=Populus alba x Populus x berolinensis TaxID=444605 RepID=A0AAD6RAC6_9ROSI|nr:hypothetical protein NC652_009478 [Populus alba x Populus x berolinensis]KAJ7004647.1 hypothetical protein NC653_009476 [Populus alba x Populus x berolinensis]
MGVSLVVLPRCSENCLATPIKQAHLHLRTIPVNELDHLVHALTLVC